MLHFRSFMEIHFKRKITQFIFSLNFHSRKKFLKFRHYLQTKLPICLKDHFMNELLLAYSGEKHDKYIVKRILDILLSEDTRTLIIYPYKYHFCPKPSLWEKLFQRYLPFLFPFNDIIQLIKLHRPSLTHLELYNEYLKYSDFEEILEFTPNLRLLKVKSYHLQDEDFLGTILRKCPLLEELVLSGKSIDLTTIDLWLPNRNLRKFVFRASGRKFPQISSSNLIKIVEKFPNLESLTLILRFPEDLTFISKLPKNLKELKFCTHSLEAVEKIHHYFPKMQSLLIERAESSLMNFLQKFRNLNSVTLYSCQPSDIMDMVTICGQQLKSLTLGVGKINLNLLLERCPNLEILILYLKRSLPGYDDQNWNMLIEDRFSEVVFHENLKRFHLNCFPYINATQFLRSLSGIETLSFNYLEIDELTNLYQLIPSWKNLRSFKIPRAPKVTLDCLIDICNSCDRLEEIVLPRHIYENDIKNDIREDIKIIDKMFNNFCFKIDLDHGSFSYF